MLGIRPRFASVPGGACSRNRLQRRCARALSSASILTLERRSCQTRATGRSPQRFSLYYGQRNLWTLGLVYVVACTSREAYEVALVEPDRRPRGVFISRVAPAVVEHHHASLGTVLAPERDRASSNQVAHHNAAGVSLANRDPCFRLTNTPRTAGTGRYPGNFDLG